MGVSEWCEEEMSVSEGCVFAGGVSVSERCVEGMSVGSWILRFL